MASEQESFKSLLPSILNTPSLPISKWITMTLPNEKIATFVPFMNAEEAPHALLNTIHSLLNHEIEDGNTYPQDKVLTRDEFMIYYCNQFLGVLLDGDHTLLENNFESFSQLNFSSLFLGSFYIKPNYPGRSRYTCNGGFLVSTNARGQSIGTILGQFYLHYAPLCGFRQSIFNLVYATNAASYKIWDKLGFIRIGIVPNAACLRSYGFTDAYIYFYNFYPNNDYVPNGGESNGNGDQHVVITKK